MTAEHARLRPKSSEILRARGDERCRSSILDGPIGDGGRLGAGPPVCSVIGSSCSAPVPANPNSRSVVIAVCRRARQRTPSLRGILASAMAGIFIVPCTGTMLSGYATADESAVALEEIYVLRSIRERHESAEGWCAPGRTGFEPFPKDAERFYSFWSVRSRPEDGRVVGTKEARVAELRGCFGATSEPPRQNFYAEIRLGSVSFRGNGECLAMKIDFPATGLFPVRCQLVLSGLPAPYVGGLLTTNTVTSRAAFGEDTEPPGYTQASIATIRLWRSR
jgi:hypothetical protein